MDYIAKSLCVCVCSFVLLLLVLLFFLCISNAINSSINLNKYIYIYIFIWLFCRVIKASKNALTSSIGNLQLTEGEMVLDVDGTVPTQPVLQHIGISLWPGK